MIKKLVVIFATLFTLQTFPAMSGEADVIGVDIRARSDGSHRIAVTVVHADEGWDHYADGWEVLDLEGNVLDKRVLGHPHVNEQPFTRAKMVTLPEGIEEITLRAHDNVHGYGGKTMTVKVPRR